MQVPHINAPRIPNPRLCTVMMQEWHLGHILAQLQHLARDLPNLLWLNPASLQRPGPFSQLLTLYPSPEVQGLGRIPGLSHPNAYSIHVVLLSKATPSTVTLPNTALLWAPTEKSQGSFQKRAYQRCVGKIQRPTGVSNGKPLTATDWRDQGKRALLKAAESQSN